MRLPEGRTATADFTVSVEDMTAFRRLSGDDNPLHDDAEFARSRGFAGPVVYGGLIIAQVSRLLGTRLPGHGCVWRSLTLRFRAPLFVDEPARVAGTVVYESHELGLLTLRLRVEASRRLIAEGEAAAQLIGERAHA